MRKDTVSKFKKAENLVGSGWSITKACEKTGISTVTYAKAAKYFNTQREEFARDTATKIAPEDEIFMIGEVIIASRIPRQKKMTILNSLYSN